MLKRRRAPILALLTVVLTAPAVGATSVYTGYEVIFERPAGLAGSDPAGWDVLTGNVALARGTIQGLFNAVVEAGYTAGSPADTEWATGISSPGEAISAANYTALSFTSWENAFGGLGQVGIVIESTPAVLHLISDDIYLDMRFTLWGKGSAAGGAFTYERSAIPEPTTAHLLVLGLAGLAALAASGRARPRRES